MTSSGSEYDADLTPPKKRRRQDTENSGHSNKQNQKSKVSKLITGKQSINKKNAQRFRTEWLDMPAYKDWLGRVVNDPFKAKCKLCDNIYTADTSVLNKHMSTNAHTSRTRAKLNSKTTIMTKFIQQSSKNIDTPLDIAVKKAEIKLTGFFAEHDMDHLTDLLKEIFPDSQIAQKVALKKTKARQIVTNVIGSTEKSDITGILLNKKFSILTDESTDISATKTSCIIVRIHDDIEKRIPGRN